MPKRSFHRVRTQSVQTLATHSEINIFKPLRNMGASPGNKKLAMACAILLSLPCDTISALLATLLKRCRCGNKRTEAWASDWTLSRMTVPDQSVTVKI
jgi:hypothetical protein